MPTIPYYCPTCRQMYSANHVFVGAGASVTMGENVTTTCPNGHMAKYLPATYTGTQNDLIQILNPSTTTVQILREIYRIADEARQGVRPSQEAIDEITKLAPALKPVVDIWTKAGFFVGLFALIVSILQLYKEDPQPSVVNNVTINNYVNEAREPERLSKRQLQRARGKEKAERQKQDRSKPSKAKTR